MIKIYTYARIGIHKYDYLNFRIWNSEVFSRDQMMGVSHIELELLIPNATFCFQSTGLWKYWKSISPDFSAQ